MWRNTFNFFYHNMKPEIGSDV